VTTSGDGDGEGGEKEKEKEKDKDKDKDPKKHLDPFERNGGKSIPLQLKALNECLLGSSLTHSHAFPLPSLSKILNLAYTDTAVSTGVSNNASLSFERAGLLMGPHNSYVRAEAAFQLATWQNERMPRVLSTAVAGGSTSTLTLFNLHVPLPYTPALLLPSLHLISSHLLVSPHLISTCHNLRSVPRAHSAALCAVRPVLASGYRPAPAQRLLQ
jgi:hypothetical protein